MALSLTSDATTAAQSASAEAAGDNSTEADSGKGRLMTSEDKAKIRDAIQKATNTEEIRKLERMLAEGRMPVAKQA